MLAELGMQIMDELLDKVVPESIRRRKELEVKASLSERQVLNRLYQISIRNQLFKSFIGMGYHNTHTPTVIERNLLRNPGLVYRLHTLPGRNIAGTARSAAQFPDHDQ